jgi:hypothetical protein
MGKSLIRSVSIKGARGSNRWAFESATRLSPNQPFKKKDINEAIRALRATGLVDGVRVTGEKTGHLVFTVKEIPIVRSLTVSGNSRLKRDLIRQEITTELEKLFSQKTLESDLARIAKRYERAGLEIPAISGTTYPDGRWIDIEITIDETPLTGASPAKTRRRTRAKGNGDSDSWEGLGITERFTRAEHPVAQAGQTADLSATDVDIPGDAESGDKGRASSAGTHRANSSDGASRDRSWAEPNVDIAAFASAWTGRPTFQDRVRVVRAFAPVVMSEIDTLVQLVEAERFNDPETDAALNLLRSLHEDLGELIEAVEARKDKPLLVRLARKNAKLVRVIKSGARVGAVAPALTIGISHLLSALTHVPIDSTMVSSVFATMVTLPLVEHQVSNLALKDRK